MPGNAAPYFTRLLENFRRLIKVYTWHPAQKPAKLSSDAKMIIVPAITFDSKMKFDKKLIKTRNKKATPINEANLLGARSTGLGVRLNCLTTAPLIIARGL